MKKVIICVAIATLGVLSASAQKESSSTSDFKFSIGVEGALPLSDLKTSSNFGIGGSLQGEYKASTDFGVTLSAGYLSFSGKNFTFDGVTEKAPKISFIPVLVGGKYYFTSSVYGSAQFGITFLSVSDGGGSTSAFTYAPGIGYYITPNFDLLLKYQGASKSGGTLSFLGLRAAYNF